MSGARSFSALSFNPRRGLDGIHAVTFFENGYGASVVRGYGTYGNEHGLYELAVIAGDKDGWDLDYETPITDDVEGWLSEERITELLMEIAALPPAAEQVA
jgi:hypothetical protein